MPGQAALFSAADFHRPGAGATGPVLDSYDILLANISGGKDSQEMLRHLVEATDAAGVRGRIVAVFADLGKDDEWPGTRELAEYHASVYGVRFEVVQREVTDEDGERHPQSLSEHIENRGMWPDAARRYCTSDLKRAPVLRLMTRLAAEQHTAGVTGRVRILNVMGLRAQESTFRRLMSPFSHDERASNKTKRYVDEWLPIHHLTKDQVWTGIRASGVKYHPIYDLGLPRLSCRFCILAPRSALIRAAQLDPAGAAKRAGMEARMGHRFRTDISMAEIIEQAKAAPAGPVKDWRA